MLAQYILFNHLFFERGGVVGVDSKLKVENDNMERFEISCLIKRCLLPNRTSHATLRLIIPTRWRNLLKSMQILMRCFSTFSMTIRIHTSYILTSTYTHINTSSHQHINTSTHQQKVWCIPFYAIVPNEYPCFISHSMERGSA